MRGGKGVHTIRVRRRCRGGWQQTRQRHNKSPTSEIYTFWACILSDSNIFCTLRGGRTMAGSNAPAGLDTKSGLLAIGL